MAVQKLDAVVASAVTSSLKKLLSGGALAKVVVRLEALPASDGKA